MWVRRTALVVAAAMSLGACGGGSHAAAQHVKTQARAVPIAAVRTAHKSLGAHLPERVFALGDAFGAVDYQLSFTRDARNADAVTAACGRFLSAHNSLEGELKSLKGDVGDVATRILGATASAVTTCGQAPSAVDDASAEAVHLDFSSFRELSFDFAQLAAPKA